MRTDFSAESESLSRRRLPQKVPRRMPVVQARGVKPKHPHIENALLSWIARQKTMPTTGTILLKAWLLSKNFNEQFGASGGWLDKFQSRHHDKLMNFNLPKPNIIEWRSVIRQMYQDNK
jgi:hypothetical protein